MTTTPGPTYALVRIQELFRADAWYLSGVAFTGMSDLGLDKDDVIACVLALSLGDFKKTMPADKRPGSFQDVYKPEYLGQPLYVKLQIVGVDPNEQVVVISFKER